MFMRIINWNCLQSDRFYLLLCHAQFAISSIFITIFGKTDSMYIKNAIHIWVCIVYTTKSYFFANIEIQMLTVCFLVYLQQIRNLAVEKFHGCSWFSNINFFLQPIQFNSIYRQTNFLITMSFCRPFTMYVLNTNCVENANQSVFNAFKIEWLCSCSRHTHEFLWSYWIFKWNGTSIQYRMSQMWFYLFVASSSPLRGTYYNIKFYLELSTK